MFDPAHLVFLDETAANTKMMRLGGRCLRGDRLTGQVPHGHSENDNLRRRSLRCKGMTAPYVIDGGYAKGKTFLDYVEQRLAPTLRRNDTVVSGQPSGNTRQQACAKRLKRAWRRPSLSAAIFPEDLNPIEMPFSKLKAYLRKVAERTIPRLRRRIRTFALHLTASEAKNYFRHAGYA